MLVTFGNLRDPMSVTEVDPANLSAQFGEGVRLRRITVQVTDDDVTEGIERRLGWLKTLHGGYLNGAFADDGRVPLGLYGGNFSSERFQ
jgi:hypothetical protein